MGEGRQEGVGGVLSEQVGRTHLPDVETTETDSGKSFVSSSISV